MQEGLRPQNSWSLRKMPSREVYLILSSFNSLFARFTVCQPFL